MPTAPDLTAVKEYLGADSSWSDEEVQGALDAERVAQVNACTLPPDADPEDPQPYPHPLAEALKRRVRRNLAMRSNPLGIQTGPDTVVRVGSTDPEVRRLEAPYRKRVVG